MTDTDLFDVRRKRVTKPTNKAVVSPKHANAVFARYRDLFTEKFGEPPAHPTQKEGSTVRRLIAAYGVDKVLARLDGFMALEDDYIRDTVGYTLTGLHSKWNWLTGKLAVPQVRPTANHDVARLREQLKRRD